MFGSVLATSGLATGAMRLSVTVVDRRLRFWAVSCSSRAGPGSAMSSPELKHSRVVPLDFL